MPTVKQIDSYIEERVVKTWNNRPMYQLVIKIDSITDSVSYYDVGFLLAELDTLIMIQGIGYVPQISDWETYSNKTSNIKLGYEKSTGYLKIEIDSYPSVINNSINFYYIKDEGTMRASLREAETEFHPVLDVHVNGTSVIDDNRIAQIKSYKEVTADEYESLPDSKLYDDVMYCVKGRYDTVEEGNGVLDVKIDGESIVDRFGIANITQLVTQLDLAKKQNLLVAGNNITLVELEDGTVRISATGGGGGTGTITDVTVNGSSVVSGTTAVITMPTKTSDLNNDSGFITNTTNSLTNYYTKTATEDKIDQKIDAIPIATGTAKGLMSPEMVTKLNSVIIDVKVDGVTTVVDGVAIIDLSNKQNTLTAGTGIDITNDTISVNTMVGATDDTSGIRGAVPAPAITDKDKFLKGDGTWAQIEGGGNVDDVMVNGVSVVDSNKIAQVKSYKELTQSEYDALPDSKYTDGVMYCIKDDGPVEGNKFTPIIYSLEEREVGVWTDGKPLYQRTWIGMVTPSSSSRVYTNFLDLTSANIDTFVNAVGVWGDGNKRKTLNVADNYSMTLAYETDNKNLQILTTNLTSTSRSIWVTFWYTKTTDTPGSGIWTPSGIPAHHYSTEEQVVGTWIDGKPIYEKTYSIAMTDVPSNIWTTTGISRGNISAILNSSFSNVNGNYYPFCVGKLNDEIAIRNLANQSITYNGYLTIQYTKTTD